MAGLYTIAVACSPPLPPCTVSTVTKILEWQIESLTSDMIWFVLHSSVWAIGWTVSLLLFPFSVSLPPLYRCCPLSMALLPDHQRQAEWAIVYVMTSSSSLSSAQQGLRVNVCLCVCKWASVALYQPACQTFEHLNLEWRHLLVSLKGIVLKTLTLTIYHELEVPDVHWTLVFWDFKKGK